MRKWLRRWRYIGYRQLWHLHYGGAHEGDKGCQRRYDFMLEVTEGWHHAFQSERSMLQEAEELLIGAGIEPPIEARHRRFMERIASSGKAAL